MGGVRHHLKHRAEEPNQLRRPVRGRHNWFGLCFVAPALTVYAAFVLFPLCRAIYYSLHDWAGIGEMRFIGLDNYREALVNPLLRTSIANALKLIVFFAVIPVSAGLLLTSLIARNVRRGLTGYRLVFFVPYVIPMVATGIVWRWMYNPNGIVNQMLSAIGLGGVTRAWLGDFDFALIAVGLIGSWMLSGFCMMLFLAGAQRIDESLYEAAVLDGAGPWWQFRAVTLPGLRREISVALVVTTIAALASFDIVFVTTNGGPGDETVVPGLLAYRLAFRQQRVGLAAALAVMLTILVFTIAGLVRQLSRERS